MIKVTISGGDGIDTVRIDHSNKTTSSVIDFGDTSLSEQTLANGTVLKNIEQFDLLGGSARDILVGGALHDTLSGGGSADMLEGGAGDDYLDGGAGDDLMNGGLGNDTYVVSGSDIIIDDGGIDKILVGSSFSLAAFAQIEELAVQSATSTGSINLTGNALANTLTGNAGANILQGMAGNDRLVGGMGKDLFDFRTPLHRTLNVDTIMDFVAADDTIRIDDAVFKGLKRGQLVSTAFVKGKKAADKYDRIIYDKSAGALYFDADGTGAAKQVLFAKIANKAALSHLDFVVI